MKHRARLTSADAFLLVLERMMASAGQGMHLGLTVLRLGPGFDLERFRAAVERAAAACPFGQAQIGQRFGGVLHWRWEDGARANFPIQTHREGEIDEAELSRRRLNEPLATGVAFDVILSESGCTVLMTWRHLLLDGKGAELLLAEIGRLAEDPEAKAVESSWDSAERKLTPRDWLRESKLFKENFYKNAKYAIVSPSGADLRAGSADFWVENFDEAETQRITERAAEITKGMFQLAWFLAISMRVHREIFLRRGAEPESYQASCAVQQRKRGAHHPIWQNQVSQLFFCLPAPEAVDRASAARSLHEQFVQLSRQRMDSAFMTMGRLLRRLSPGMYLKFIRSHSGGHITSFFYSHTGAFLPERTTFAGAAVLNGWHVPSVSAPPGTGLFFSERGGRLTAVCSWRSSAITPEESALMRTTLRAELLGS